MSLQENQKGEKEKDSGFMVDVRGEEKSRRMDLVDVMNKDNATVLEFLDSKGQELGGNSDSGTMEMTGEQMMMLKKQIVVFHMLSCRLVQMYKDISSAQSVPGMRMEKTCCNIPPLLSPEMKTTTRQRWSPAPMQLQVLEGIFEKGGNGIPDKQKIREITSTLSQYGMISDANVCNWFQNRRARCRRNQKRRLLPKREAAGAQNDSGVNTSNHKRSRTVDANLCENKKSPR